LAAQGQFSELAFFLPSGIASFEEKVQAVVEEIAIAAYTFERHKSRPSAEPLLKRVVLVVPRVTDSLKKSLERGQSFAEATNFARDLINEPPSLKTPETLAKVAAALSGRGVTVKVYHRKDLQRMKMNALLGVSRGSAHPPILVHLTYRPSRKIKKRLAFVGKGVTFDSGGLSLKPANSMTTMKYDMAGAATVFSLFKVLAKMQPNVEIHGITPLTENMPGQDAYKPGDVLRAANGKTIEVLNTDAEGRVILADALSYASKLPVDEIVDIATLTGAATVALGHAYGCLMTNNDSMAEHLSSAATQAGEKLWRLPLEETYKEHMKSSVADLKNIGNPSEAGTIIGGLFLQEFIGKKPWAHIDMASVGWNEKGPTPGASGAMVRTLLNYIL
jgi:leucyl aminopeptidase